MYIEWVKAHDNAIYGKTYMYFYVREHIDENEHNMKAVQDCNLIKTRSSHSYIHALADIYQEKISSIYLVQIDILTNEIID